MIPNALPGIISGGVLAFARGLGEFGATAIAERRITTNGTKRLPLKNDKASGNLRKL